MYLTIDEIKNKVGLIAPSYEQAPLCCVYHGDILLHINTLAGSTELSLYSLEGWNLKFYGDEGFLDIGYIVGEKDGEFIVIDPMDGGFVYPAVVIDKE